MRKINEIDKRLLGKYTVEELGESLQACDVCYKATSTKVGKHTICSDICFDSKFKKCLHLLSEKDLRYLQSKDFYMIKQVFKNDTLVRNTLENVAALNVISVTLLSYTRTKLRKKQEYLLHYNIDKLLHILNNLISEEGGLLASM